MGIDREDVRRWGVPALVVLVVATAMAGAWWGWGRSRPEAANVGSAPIAAAGQGPGPVASPSDNTATEAVHRGGELLLARPGTLRATLYDPENSPLASAEGRTDGAVRLSLGGVTGTANPDGTVTIEGTTVPLGAPPFDGPTLVEVTRSGPATRSGDHYVVMVEGRPLQIWLGPSGRIVRLVNTDTDGIRMDVQMDE